MDLREYFFRERMQVKDFAAKIGYAPTYISRISVGNLTPGKRLAKTITEATNGKVTFEEKEKKSK